MIYGSICSGIEAATVAWHPLGWKPAFFSEIEAFPRAVLEHHYPDVPLHGDFTTIKENDYGSIDLLCGGTPCQSFSVAGLRKGLNDDRGNLTLEFVRLAARKKPRWLVWENVPGVLSLDKGRAFGAFLGGLAECGYGFSYRVLDAQYFGVPQRRRRVVVIGYLGDWRPAAAVLLERESLRGDLTPSREKEKTFTPRADDGSNVCSRSPFVLDRAAFNQGENAQFDIKIERSETIPSLVARGPHAVAARMVALGEYDIDGTASTVKARDYKDATDLVCVHGTQDPCTSNHTAFALGRNNGGENCVRHSSSISVRRLTPVECERLQGFPDGYTDIRPKGKPTPDGPRYKALGNSWAVPKFKWIGERINLVNEILTR